MAVGIASALKVFGNIIHAPRFQPAVLCAVEARRKPSVDPTAGKSCVLPFGAEKALRCVAGAAKAEAFDQIAAAIPLSAFVLVGLENARTEESEVPQSHQRTIVQLPIELASRRRVVDGIERLEVGAEREDVVARYFREMRVGERRVFGRAIRPLAIAHGAKECLVGPSADPGIEVGRQIGGIDPAERRIDPLSSGEWL